MSIISKYNLQSTNEGSRYLTFCTMNNVQTHQHEAHQLLEDFMRVGLYWTTQYPNALASYFNAFSLSRFLNISVSCYSRLFFTILWVGFRFKLLDKGYNFLLFVFVPEAPIFWLFFLIYTVSCLGLKGSMNSGLKNPKNWQPISPPYLLSLHLIYPYFNTTGHSTLCSFSQCRIVPHILSLPIALSFPQSFSHGLIPSIRPFLCPSQTIYREWHPFPFHPSSFHHHLQHKTPRGKKQQKKSRGKESEKRNERLGWKKKTLISKALNPILYHG